MHTHAHGRLRHHRIGIALLLNAVIFLVELSGGIFANSLALISDAMHNLSDCLALVLSYFASRLMLRKSDAVRSYGYGRVEILAAFVNAVILALVGAYIVYAGVRRFLAPEQVKGGWMLAVALIGFGANSAAALLLKPDAARDLNLKSAYIHLLTDAAESLGVVLVAVLLVWQDGWGILDPILSLLIGLFVVKGAWDLILETTNILTEGTPRGIDLHDVAAFISSFPGIQSVHHVHIWGLSSEFRALSAHIVMEDQLISEGGRVVRLLEEGLDRRFGINHPTLQIESGACSGQDIIVDLHHPNPDRNTS